MGDSARRSPSLLSSGGGGGGGARSRIRDVAPIAFGSAASVGSLSSGGISGGSVSILSGGHSSSKRSRPSPLVAPSLTHVSRRAPSPRPMAVSSGPLPLPSAASSLPSQHVWPAARSTLARAEAFSSPLAPPVLSLQQLPRSMPPQPPQPQPPPAQSPYPLAEHLEFFENPEEALQPTHGVIGLDAYYRVHINHRSMQANG
jgi:hypothetical protein